MSRRTGGREAKAEPKLNRYSHAQPPQQVLAPPKIKYDEPIAPEDLAITCDVSGGEATGKSHFARTWPGGLGWIETPPEWGKADVILNKFRTLYNDDKIVKLKRVATFDDIRQVCRALIADDDIKTIVIDSGTHLRPLAGIEWCEEEGKDSVYPTTNWQYPNMKIDQLIAEVKRGQKHLVITNRLHDEWVGDASTGRQVRHGHKPFTYDFHVVIQLVFGIRPKVGGTACKSHRFGRVHKNAFWGIDEDTNLNYGKPYLFKATYNGIMEELANPWGPHPVQDSLDVCFNEAKALFEPSAAKPKTETKLRR